MVAVTFGAVLLVLSATAATSAATTTTSTQVIATTCDYDVGANTLPPRGDGSQGTLSVASAHSEHRYDDFAHLVGTSAHLTGGFLAPQTSDPDCGQYLYRGGSAGQKSLTPRPVNDTEGYPRNGLSTYYVKAKACVSNDRVQVLDPLQLAAVDGLALTVDSGDATHVFLQGDTEELHLEWAATRDETEEHRLTTGVRGAILRSERC